MMSQMIDREQIKEILPHREPMLLIDSAEVTDGVSIGRYTIKGDEWFLKGHFPDNPVVPGVILCEMMAQSVCALLVEYAGKGVTPYFSGIDKIRFKQPVLPGDTVEFICSLNARKGPFFFINGTGKVGEKVCIKGEFSFVVKEGKE